MISEHPHDWILHNVICLVVAFLIGWDKAIVMAVTIELTQIEAGIKQPWWDYAIDLFFDLVGTAAGAFLASLFERFPLWQNVYYG